MTISEILLQKPGVQATSEEIAAQRQWMETGTVPLDYLAARSGQSMSTADDPIMAILTAVLAPADKGHKDE